MDISAATYTAEQVAKRYHREVDTINRWVRNGLITALNPFDARSGYIFRQEDLEDFEERAAAGGRKEIRDKRTRSAALRSGRKK